MPLSFNGINQSEIEISGGVNISKKTTAFSAVSAGPSTNTTLGTVPAGKKWIITSATLVSGANTAMGADGELQINGVACIKNRVVSLAATAVVVSTTKDYGYEAGLIATAGQVIRMVNAAAVSGSADIVYVEEDA